MQVGELNRRELITVFGGAAVAWLAQVWAQEPRKTPRIGFLGPATAPVTGVWLLARRGGLRELGYEEGKNLAFEFRWAEGNDDRLADLASELVRLDVDVLVTYGTPGTRAAKQATTTIPIVMAVSGDALATGLVS